MLSVHDLEVLVEVQVWITEVFFPDVQVVRMVLPKANHCPTVVQYTWSHIELVGFKLTKILPGKAYRKFELASLIQGFH